MGKKKITAADVEKYIAFLQKRVDSKNYKSNVSDEEFEKTKAKLAKEKDRLKLMKPKGSK